MSTKRKAPGKLAAPTVKSSARRATKSVIDESRTSVAGTDALPSSQQDAIEISSDEASDDGFTDEEEAAMADESMTGTEAPPQLNGNHSGKPGQRRALRTDDVDLLESCLHTTDRTTIQNTIESIDSALAGNLLNKLAARLYRRPGRAGTLMTWVQLTLIAHGGALASQPKVIQSLSGLQKVLAERAKGLTSLLALKGKLDMLESQMDLRRRMQHRSRAINQGEDEDEEEDVVWVEGEVEDEELGSGLKSRRRRVTDDDDDSDVPALNGAIGESSDEDDDSEEEIDDSEDEGESLLDEDEVDHDDVDDSMGEDEESDVEAAPPSKVQKVAKSFSKRK
uniref:Small-subunit processome Utp12 domain-containing protein n=2 Tax=Bionectria ochroleuca TaxID=29856 RepID=A0A0B7JNW3_BIOOC